MTQTFTPSDILSAAQDMYQSSASDPFINRRDYLSGLVHLCANLLPESEAEIESKITGSPVCTECKDEIATLMCSVIDFDPDEGHWGRPTDVRVCESCLQVLRSDGTVVVSEVENI